MLHPVRPAKGARTSAGAIVAAITLATAAVPSVAAAGFYDPPPALPADNGALVKTEPMRLGVQVDLGLFNKRSLPGKATRIMYKTTDTNGDAVAVTGVYIEPSARSPIAGKRPLVSFAEGTQGQGDMCAPSRTLEKPLSLNLDALTIGYEVPGIYRFLSKGYGVVVTDYVGLGTTDRVHTYVNRLDQGRAVLDAARAATKVAGASVTPASPVGAYGYSQGGGAAASAAELQPSYAPDVNLKGAYAGAPPADLNAVMRTADGSLLTAVIGFAVNGFVETYPELQAIIDAETNDAGKTALANISTGCIGNGLFGYGFQKTSKWTKSGRTIAEVVDATPQVKAIVDAQRIGNIKPQVPVRISTGTKDDIVTHSQVKQLAADWCALGATVEYNPVRQLIDTRGTALNHLTPMLTDLRTAQDWLGQRLAGKPASSNCGQVPSLP